VSTRRPILCLLIVLAPASLSAAQSSAFAPVVQQPKLQPTDLQKNYSFGEDLAIEGDTLVVATRGDKHTGAASGAVHVYEWDGGAWGSDTKLIADEPHTRDAFGSSVAIWGDMVAVGAELETHSTLSRAGAAYLFERDGDGYRQQARVTASDAAANDSFGYAVDVDGDTLVVSALLARAFGVRSVGAVYVFTRSGETWAQVQKLSAPEALESTTFGRSVALSGDTLLVGADGARVDGLMSGAAYVYQRGDAGFAYEATLAPARPEDDQLFGLAVALEGDRALVGSPLEGPTGAQHGAAYVFERSGAGWQQTAHLAASDPHEARFGVAVSLDGDAALIGAASARTSSVKAGAAYFFVLSSDGWLEQARLAPDDGLADDAFGTAVGLSNHHLIVGAPGRDDFGTKSGAVYPFEGGSLLLDDD
jgi:hypothetical protein